MSDNHRQPRVSVIMPVHNAAASLERAMASVLGQTLRDLELLIVDDASTDGSAELARRVAGADDRVRCFRLDANRGQSAARNLAIDQARGTWVAPVDADDEIAPRRLALLCDTGERAGAELVADHVQFTTPYPPGAVAQADSRGRGCLVEQLSLAALIESDIPLNGQSSFGYLKPLMLRAFLDAQGLRYDESLRFAEDLDLYARALACGARFLLHPQSHYLYNQTPVSASRDIRALPGVANQALITSDRLAALARRLDDATLAELARDHRQRWSAVLWFNQLKVAVREGRPDQALRLTLGSPINLPALFSFVRARRRDRRSGWHRSANGAASSNGTD